MAIEIVDFPVENGGSFHSFLYVYQRVDSKTCFGMSCKPAPRLEPLCRCRSILGWTELELPGLVNVNKKRWKDPPFHHAING
jgi:hypothetical protein